MRIGISTLFLAGVTAGMASMESSSSKVASSSRLHERSYVKPLSLLEQNRLTVELLPPTCNLNACIGLTGTISCIASALQARDSAALSKCLTNGLQGICSCAACVPALSSFLNSLGICLSVPGGGGNATATPSMQMQMNTFVTSTMVPGKSGVSCGMMTVTPTPSITV
ncbi:uncharacterized protein N7473_000464 [Penicillium subrubescens]|uniref:uncharacterized protein n=1 Tax=Penicillium subrubescens TaxID=1316194 RepID=UPI002545302F|nr:uncharacterized protein N7473_000464 [Penicillium subrubescens]KAJ5911161.1 hypothetical protein N7473_000464 [Penicillium subrubescens]